MGEAPWKAFPLSTANHKHTHTHARTTAPHHVVVRHPCGDPRGGRGEDRQNLGRQVGQRFFVDHHLLPTAFLPCLPCLPHSRCSLYVDNQPFVIKGNPRSCLLCACANSNHLLPPRPLRHMLFPSTHRVREPRTQTHALTQRHLFEASRSTPTHTHTQTHTHTCTHTHTHNTKTHTTQKHTHDT